MSQSFTLSQIADRLAEPAHRVRYAVRACRIEPAMWGGRVRVYSEQQIPVIRAALEQTKAKRSTSLETSTE